MQMFTKVAFALLSSAAVLASPYLEFCSLLDVQTVGTAGVVIQASCGGQCEQLNIVPCFANSYGTVVPAGLTYASRPLHTTSTIMLELCADSFARLQQR